MDGVKVGTAKNDGHGGSNFYNFNDPTLERKLEAWASTLPKMEYNGREFSMDLDLAIGNIMEKMEEKKRITRLCKNKTLFLLEGDDESMGWRTLNVSYDIRVQKHLDDKYGTKVVRILNKEMQD